MGDLFGPQTSPAPPVPSPTPPQVPVDEDRDPATDALGRIAQVLAAEGGMESALAALGEALGADAVSFMPSSPDGGAGWPAVATSGLTWSREPSPPGGAVLPALLSNNGPRAGRGGAAGRLDVAATAPDGRTVGTLRVEGRDLPAPTAPWLTLLGGVLGAYWDRLAADATLGGHWRHVNDHPAPTVPRDAADRAEPDRALIDALDGQQERIGRDLHDSVGQLLTGVRMLSEGLAEAPALAQAPGDLDGTARRIAAYAAEALDHVRSLCRGLVAPPLDAGGVADALADLVEEVGSVGPMRCVFRREGDADLSDPDAALQAYRIVQEALSNALRHADASAAWVTLGRDEDGVGIEVEDNGAGFVVGADRARSVGLDSMRQRAESVGATLDVESRPGAGATVRVTFPMEVRGEGQAPGDATRA